MKTFAALADPTRLEIVELLSKTDELPAGRIAESFTSMTRAAVSRHLRTLEDAGLVVVRTRAQQRLYRLNPEPLAELDDWLDQYRALWTRKVGALKKHLEHGASSPSTLAEGPESKGGAGDDGTISAGRLEP